MPRFAKRPVVIDAVQWTGDNLDELGRFVGGWNSGVVPDPDSHSLLVNTLEGRMRCSATDWLIRGVQGELYPCRNDIFQATYEAVDVLQEQ